MGQTRRPGDEASAQVGGYELRSELGRGGMGVVYLAHREDRGFVALKTLTQPRAFALRSLRAEIALLDRLAHPGVVRLVDHDASAQVPWMAMELIAGHPLSAYLNSANTSVDATTTMQHATTTFQSQDTGAPVLRPRQQALGLMQTWSSGTQALSRGAGLGRAATAAANTTDARDALRATHPGAATAATVAAAAEEAAAYTAATAATAATVAAVGGSPRDASGSVGAQATQGRGGWDGTLPDVAAPQKASARERAGLPALEVELDTLLGWLYRVCQTLAYVHGQGVVHADIKPGNIVITEDGRAVLLDFGLATLSGNRTSAKDVERAGVMAGSLAYINPEQIRGDVLDARSDLYSFGCVLFEALMGHPPFYDADPRALLHQHIHRPVPLMGGLPEALKPLSLVVMALLAKDRHARPGHARAILHALDQGGYGRPWAGLDQRAERPYVFRPGLVGREGLMERLTGALGEAFEGRGGVVLLGGESGVGKTHVTRELVRRAREGGRRVLAGGASAPGVGAERPLGAWLPVLRVVVDACQERGDDGRAVFDDGDLAVLAPYVPALGRLARTAAVTASVVLPTLPLKAAWLRVFRSLTRVLERHRGGRAALLVVDDLHWADELSLAAFEHVSQELIAARWMVVGVLRSEEATAELSAMIERLPHTLWEVERLSDADIEAVMGQMLGQAPREALRALVVSKASGNPFFAAEYLQMAVDVGVLERNAQGQWRLGADAADGAELSALPEPSSIQELVDARLARLSGDTLAVCEAAAVLGLRLSRAHLQALSNMDAHRFHHALGALFELQVLTDDERDADLACFTHGLLREVAYARLGREPRAALHRAAAVLLEDAAVEGSASALAHHWARGGDPLRARALYAQAAQYAIDRWALADAQRSLHAALALYDDEDLEGVRLRLLCVEAVALKLNDHAQICDQALRALDACAHHEGDDVDRLRARAHLALAEAYSASFLHQADQYAHARLHVQAGLGLAEALNDARFKARALGLMGLIEVNAHDWAPDAVARAQVFYMRSYEVWCEVGDVTEQARAIHAVGTVYANQEQHAPALDCYQQALELQQRVRDRHGESLTLFNLGRLYAAQEDNAAAMRSYEQAMVGFAELGNRMAEAITLNNLAVLYLDGCAYRDAVAACTRSLELRRALGASVMTAQINLALAYARLGVLDRATALARDAIDAAQARNMVTRIELLRVFGNVALLRGDYAAVLDALDVALIDPDTYSGRHSQGPVLAMRARALLGLGEFERAEAEAREAVATALEVNLDSTARAHLALAAVLLKQERWDEAEPWIDGVIVRLTPRSPMFRAQRAWALLARAALCRARDHRSAATREATEALSVFEAIEHRVGIAHSLCARARLALDAGDDGDYWISRAAAEVDALALAPSSPLHAQVEALRAAAAEATDAGGVSSAEG